MEVERGFGVSLFRLYEVDSLTGLTGVCVVVRFRSPG